MEELKRIMRLSFKDNFFVSQRNNCGDIYLDMLTDIVVERRKTNKTDYNEVAKYICEYDSRIKRMYSEWDVYIAIPLLVHSDIFVQLFYKKVNVFTYEVSNELLRRIQKILPTKKDFLHVNIIYSVILNYSCFSAADKELILSLIENVMSDSINLKSIKQKGIYDVFQVTDNMSQDLISQIVLYKYCHLTNCIFNHQTSHSIEVFNYLDREKMYFDIRELLIEGFRKSNIHCNDEYGIVLSRLLGHELSAPEIIKLKDYGMLDYYHEWVSSDKNRSFSLLKMIFDMIELESDAYIELFFKCKELGILKSENEKLRTTIEDLTVSKVHQDNEINRIIHQYDSKQKELLKQLKTSDSEKKELYALREYIFSLSNNVFNEIDELQCIQKESIDYNEIVIIGGHIKWAQKVKERLPNIDIISADQKRVDLKFLHNKKIIIFFINYLSHSLYFQVISKIQSNQKIAFLKQRNIDEVIKEINRLYLRQ